MSRQSMYLYGKNSVLERIRAKPKSIQKIFLEDRRREHRIEKEIRARGIAIERVSSRTLAKIKRAEHLQGIVACIDAFTYTPFNDILEKPRRERPTIIFLDSIFDPHNLGAIIRTTACFGGFAIVIPKSNACEVNDTVLHVASGGENYLAIARVSNLSNAIRQAKENGYWIMGAVLEDGAQDIGTLEPPFPLGLVVGSEGEGIRHGLYRYLDMKAHIPMKAARLSLNVTVACGILCHEIVSKRKAAR